VTIKGIIDYHRQIQVLKYKDGEKGVELIAPMYTHLDKNE
jgi:hypothetical protein